VLIAERTKTGIPLFDSWPKDVAYMISDGRNGLRRVTFANLKADRIDRQRKRLARIVRLDGPCLRACAIWTFFVPGVIYGGWHLYLKTIEQSNWLRPRTRRDLDGELTLQLMQMFPCGLLPIFENFEGWKEAFAHAYTFRKKRGRKPQGIVFGWARCSQDDSCPRNFQLTTGVQ
jgi:hypothetical protein